MGYHYVPLFLTFLFLTQARTAEYGDRIKNFSETTINLEMQESRYYSNTVPKPRTEIPVNFVAPYADARDYWTEQPRRTFYDYPPENTFIRPFTESINSFYGLMNQFFGTDEPPRRKPNYPNDEPPRRKPNYPKYQNEYEYQQQPYRQQYLIPPTHKPLRASVIKLEPYRTTPHYVPYTSTDKYYPQFVKILNDVLVENTYKELGLDAEDAVEKPETTYTPKIVPTTYKPKKTPFPLKTTGFPGSIQDQLPPVKTGQDTRIPYVSEPSTTTGSTIVHGTKSTITPDIDVRSALQSGIKFSKAPITFEITTLHTPRTTPILFESTTPHTPRTTPVVFESTTSHIPRRTPRPRPTKPVVFERTTIRSVPVTFETTTDGRTGERETGQSTLTTRDPTTETTQVSTAERVAESELNVVSNFSAVQPTTAIPTAINEVPLQKDESSSSTESSKELTTAAAETTVETAKTTTTEEPTTVSEESQTQPILQIQSSEIRPVRTELIQNMEAIEPSSFTGPFPKRLDPRSATTDPTISADYVTDLTIRGLAEDSGNANLQSSRPVNNIFNMSTVVGFEIARVNGTAPPVTFDLSDELSLDAKILRDTNWDGYQPPTPTTAKPATTVEVVEPERTTAAATLATVTVTPSVEISPTTIETIYTTMGTTEIPKTTLPTPEETSVVATRITKTISSSLKANRRVYPRKESERRGRGMRNFEGRQNIDRTSTSTLEPETSTRTSRKYQRRPRVQSFKPYPSQLNETNNATTLKLGSLSRPFTPRRTRPNATLTFGNRQVGSRSSEESSSEGGTSRSTSRATPRKELYRKRMYPSQLRRGRVEQTHMVPDSDLEGS